MAHLGSDVAAFVDGQLSPAAMRDADAHLQRCDGCDRAVRQQRLLKSRMGTVSSPELPATLFSALTDLAAAAAPPQETWWDRVRRSVPARAGLVLVGASMTVAAIAYAVGGSTPAVGDRVSPPFDQYAADFFGATSRVASASVSQDTVDELTRDGWPCRPNLAGDLQRTHAGYMHGDDTIALSYTNGTTRMRLYEQTGWLDPASLDGFSRAGWGTASVWIRPGDPTLVSWDEGGVVFTMVTDADPGRIREAVAELPTRDGPAGHLTRVDHGLDRMTAWISAA